MLVRKSQLNNIIKKERAKERKICKNEFQKNLKESLLEQKGSYEEEIKTNKKDYEFELKKQNKEIKNLRNEIERNHKDYQDLRKREIELDNVSHEVESVLESISIKLNESIQPFYRTRSKLDRIKRKSDRKSTKVENIFRSAQ